MMMFKGLSLKVMLFTVVFLLCQTGLGQELYYRSYEPGASIEQKKIQTVFEDDQGLLFLGLEGGLYSFDGIYYQQIPLPDTLQYASVNSIFVWRNRLFAGLSTGHLLQKDLSLT
jgi:hypothetical protein